MQCLLKLRNAIVVLANRTSSVEELVKWNEKVLFLVRSPFYNNVKDTFETYKNFRTPLYQPNRIMGLGNLHRHIASIYHHIG